MKVEGPGQKAYAAKQRSLWKKFSNQHQWLLADIKISNSMSLKMVEEAFCEEVAIYSNNPPLVDCHEIHPN